MMTSGAGGAVHVALVGVAVAQQHQLLEHEEHQDAGEQRAEHRARASSVASASGSSASSATPSSAPTA